jgi:hypothetical protein
MTLTYDLAIVEAYAAKALPTISATATRRKRAIGQMCSLVQIRAKDMTVLPGVVAAALADDDGSPLRSPSAGVRGSDISDPTAAAAIHPSDLSNGVQRITEFVFVCSEALQAAAMAHKAGMADDVWEALRKAYNAATGALNAADRLRQLTPAQKAALAKGRSLSDDEPQRRLLPVLQCVCCGTMTPMPRNIAGIGDLCPTCVRDYSRNVKAKDEAPGRWLKDRIAKIQQVA